MAMRSVLAAVFTFLLAGLARGGERCDWTQWGQSPAHDGQACSRGQDAVRELAHLTIDPFVAQEQAETGGSLITHYQVPLLDGDDAFVLAKAGTYVSCDPPGSGEPFPCGPDAMSSQIWTEKAFKWRHGALTETWTFTSDWKPLPAALVSGWEPMFQPALDGNFIWIPGAGGTLFQVKKRNGDLKARINPFGTAIDPNAYVTGGVTVARDGNIYYNILKVDPANPASADAQGWLVRISPKNKVTMTSYATLIPGAPAASDLCYFNFSAMFPQPPRPWPPPPQPDGSPTLPPQFFCGSQRPPINVTPAVGPGGVVFTVSTAHGNSNYSYLVALKADLTFKWATSLRDLLHDGCGVLVPYGPGPSDCSEFGALGVDPRTNLLPAGGADNLSSSSPVALPDGGVIYGAFTTYNGFRGHLFKLDAGGTFQGSFDFGWDTTPAVYEHDHTFSIVVKDNFYVTGGPFFITQLDPDLNVEWRYQNTSILTCRRLDDGSIDCVDDGEHPDGFEWCVNAPAVDKDGTVYATSEDGNFYAILQGGTEKGRLFLNAAIGAAYTPIALDPKGRIYAMNNGDLSVLGR